MSLYIDRQDKGLQPIPQKDFADEGYEEHLEDILERTPFIPDGEKILIIGRQVLTNYGERIDLLGLNEDGDAIVIELKRGKTPREVIAQTLGYAAWVNNSGYEELHAIAKKYYQCLPRRKPQK